MLNSRNKLKELKVVIIWKYKSSTSFSSRWPLFKKGINILQNENTLSQTACFFCFYREQIANKDGWFLFFFLFDMKIHLFIVKKVKFSLKINWPAILMCVFCSFLFDMKILYLLYTKGHINIRNKLISHFECVFCSFLFARKIHIFIYKRSNFHKK